MLRLRDIAKAFIGLIYPNLCVACGNSLVGNEKVICLSCRYKIPKTNYWETDDNAVSQSFYGRIYLQKACSYFFFNKGSIYRKLIHKLKYNGQKDIGIALGKYFGNELNKVSWCEGMDILVPVPLYHKKQYKRGYNQSMCIAQGLSDATGLPIIIDVLVKVSDTDSQTQKGRFERWENVGNVFKVINPKEFDNKHILLIDDTMTTGATLEACAQAILSACNCKVSVATLAYVPR